MKSSLALMALRVIPKKKQQSMIVRAMNYLIEPSALHEYCGKSVSIALSNTKYKWSVLFNGNEFLYYEGHGNVSITLSFDDVLNFPNSEQVKKKVNNNEIVINGSDTDQLFVLELIDSIDQVKVTRCIRYLRRLVGVKEKHIQDKELALLTIRDVGSDSDVDYLRDQAVNCEGKSPELAYRLMHIAYGARPKGPFIKRKLNEYRQKGFNNLTQSIGKTQTCGITIPNSNIVYVPTPKVACSSIKLALYQHTKGHTFEKDNYGSRHIHDYWNRKECPIHLFEKRVLIIRDPVERFLSAYANRVLDHGELNRAAIEKSAPWLLKTLPTFKPSISQFIKHLDLYILAPSIEHHCQPLSWKLGDDLNQFTDIFTFSQIGKFEKLLQVHLGDKFEIPKAQVGKNKVTLEQLSRDELEKLLDFLVRDYQLLSPWYSQEVVRDKWKQRMKMAS
ncbi:sulfotransferase family protein [Vibrio lamellibrachiae]|uniref:sulfotransferase family 2 domain-containing protein n=1 Tax=Vibrio lamellibrachiae TaxID=2910253 RepID=UPI003D0FF1ED